MMPDRPWRAVRPRRPRVDPAAIVALLIGATALVVAIVASQQRSVVLSSGPCAVLGPATHPDLVGPHLVVDCDGVQFGVPAVLP